MSYDLAVYTPRAADDLALRRLVSQTNGLSVDDAQPGWMRVIRGARHRYAFTVDGPDRLEDEDVPPEVTRVVLGSRYLYTISVEGAAPAEIPHAVRFARRLAQVFDGAVVDQQSGELWSRSATRKIQRPRREERVATVEVRWHCLRADLAQDAAKLFLTTAARHLPEALPRRFGETEPLQGTFAEAGEEGFATAWSAATSSLYLTGSGPCVGGHLAAGPGEAYPDAFWSMGLTLLADPFREQAWRDALRQTFVTLADNLPAFYASAELTRGNIWSGRSLWSDGETESSIWTVRYREGWLGLPPKPTWWTWLGGPFAEYVPQLPAERVTKTTTGVLYEAAAEPAGAEELEPLTRWLPAGLFATAGPVADRYAPIPLVRASIVPAALRGLATG